MNRFTPAPMQRPVTGGPDPLQGPAPQRPRTMQANQMRPGAAPPVGGGLHGHSMGPNGAFGGAGPSRMSGTPPFMPKLPGAPSGPPMGSLMLGSGGSAPPMEVMPSPEAQHHAMSAGGGAAPVGGGFGAGSVGGGLSPVGGPAAPMQKPGGLDFANQMQTMEQSLGGAGGMDPQRAKLAQLLAGFK